MLISMNGELIEGFHFEELPQFNSDDPFDEEALSTRSGMRAVWLLYKQGRWDYLEDLGINRKVVEPKLRRFRYQMRLTPKQVRELSRLVPELAAASRELRLAYALKQVDKVEKRKRSKMPLTPEREPGQTFLADVPGDLAGSDMRANEIVVTHMDQIKAAGGMIDYARGMGEQAAKIRVIMPAEPKLDPTRLLPGLGLIFEPVIGVRFQLPKEAEDVPNK